MDKRNAGLRTLQGNCAPNQEFSKTGQISVKWADDGKSFEYDFDGKKYQFDIKKKKAVELGEAEREESPMARYRRMYGNRPQRGRQYTFADAPNGKNKAVYRDGNVFLTNANGETQLQLPPRGRKTNALNLVRQPGFMEKNWHRQLPCGGRPTAKN
jgi:hypothetical protein